MARVKRISDELYGFIRLNEYETRIVDLPVIQRLRRIKQLSTANMVYPGATHSRFSHAVGSMHLMGQIASKLAEDGFIPRDDVELLKVAALLHDAGIFPYTHALEPLYLQSSGGAASTRHLFRRILSRTEVRDRLEANGFTVDEVEGLVEGSHREKLYVRLLNGDLGVKRLDYLPRDARHTGVAYGLIDVGRIVETITVDDEGEPAVPTKSLQAAENFYVARLHMYQAVYYHKTIIGYEILLNAIFERLAEEMEGFKETLSTSWLDRLVDTGLVAYWDDYWVHSKLYQALEDEDVSGETKRMIKMFLDRRGLKVLVDVSRLSNEKSSEEDYRRLREYRERALEKAPGSAIYPFADDIPVSGEQPAKILLKNGRSYPITSQELGALPSYMPKYYLVLRLYVDPLYKDKLSDLAL